MHAVSTNQVADILHFNDNKKKRVDRHVFQYNLPASYNYGFS